MPATNTINSFINLDFLNLININSFTLPPIVLWILFGFVFVGVTVMSMMLYFHWVKYGINTLLVQLMFFSGIGVLLYMAFMIVSAYSIN